MTALPPDRPEPDPHERRVNRRRTLGDGLDPKRQRDLGVTWSKRQAAAVARRKRKRVA
jgi:hypothetical protein